MTETIMKKERPKHLDLRVIKQPLPAIASILHRVSGAGLFLMLPFLIYLFELSLDSSLGFNIFKAFVAYPLVKLILIG
ncbi:MAG: succinate dehydrogenase, cytochrome b556 subunit, partial [Rhodocyclaceae bacterium]|nr:succinate dehydrogenase, cytochrome b556 subunit [Rhodocyclaceae bacterium]